MIILCSKSRYSNYCSVSIYILTHYYWTGKDVKINVRASCIRPFSQTKQHTGLIIIHMNNPPGNDERRLMNRVEFRTHIILRVGKAEFNVEGSSKDLSLKGVFVHTKEDIPIGTKCLVEIILTGLTDRQPLEMQGKIIRKEPEGLAISFGSIDLDSYNHLKNIVTYNAFNDTDTHEKRDGIRVDFKTQIALRVGESEIRVEGSSKDLSLKGIFVHTKEDIPIGTKCEVDIILTGLIDSITLQMKGKVVRKDSDGIAILFDSVDLDSYTHLKNIVRYNALDTNNID